MVYMYVSDAGFFTTSARLTDLDQFIFTGVWHMFLMSHKDGYDALSCVV
jgi:hypothetical protein